MHSYGKYAFISAMTPKQLVTYLDAEDISRGEFAKRLNITRAAIDFWISEGFIAYDRQCHIQLETKGKLRASWDDVPKEKRPDIEKEERVN